MKLILIRKKKTEIALTEIIFLTGYFVSDLRLEMPLGSQQCLQLQGHLDEDFILKS